MDTKADSANAAKSVQGFEAASKKIYVRNSEDPPHPIYTNGVEFAGVGMDIFMDVGSVAPESIVAAVQSKQKAPDSKPTVNLNVLYRFGMTIQTAIQMHQKLAHLIAATQAQLAQMEASEPPQAEKS